MPKFRMRKRQNRLLGVIVCSLFSIFFFWVFSLGFSKKKIDLNTVNKITDTVRHTGVEASSSSRTNAMEFTLHLDPLYVYTLFRSNASYDDLLQKLKPGDIVSVYYKQGVGFGVREIVQLERDGKTIISKSELEKKNTIGNYLILTFAVLCLVMAFVSFLQFRRAARW